MRMEEVAALEVNEVDEGAVCSLVAFLAPGGMIDDRLVGSGASRGTGNKPSSSSL